MMNYRFDYQNNSYVLRKNPQFNPFWIAVAIAILIYLILLIYT